MTIVPPSEIPARLASYCVGPDDEMVALRLALTRAERDATMLREQALSLRLQLAAGHIEAEQTADALEERLDATMHKLSNARGLWLPIIFATSAFWVGIFAVWRWIG
jgi:hypothetical protein